MNDDWILKEEKIEARCSICNGTGKEYFNSPSAYAEHLCQQCLGKGYEKINIYYKPDIETLRQKLIEDFTKERDSIAMITNSWWQVAMNKAIDIINKRFGVEK